MSQQQQQRQRQQIENQLTSYLKRIKRREQEHHKLCEFINKLIHRQKQLEQIVFIHDQIRKLELFLQENKVGEKVHQDADQKLAKRCDHILTEEEQKVLGKRIMSRILEVTFAAIQTFRQFREYYSVNYLRFKQKCLKIISQGSCKPSVAVRMGSKYLSNKMNVEHQRLNQAITCLQLTNYDAFLHLKSTYYELLIRKQANFTIKRQKSIPADKDQSPRLNFNKISLKQQSSTCLQRDSKNQIRVRPKAKSTKEQQKARQKKRKADTKKIKKLAACLLQVMDLCKEQLLEDLAPQNKDWQQKRLLGGLIARNKVNQSHISTFMEKQQNYYDITSRPLPSHTTQLQRYHSLEKQLVQKDDDEVQIIQNSFTAKNIKFIDGNKKGIMAVKRRQSMRVVPLSGNNKPNYKNQRATVNNIQDFDQKKKQKHIFSSNKQINNEQVVQIQLKGAMKLPKAIFPQISARASSVSKKNIQKKQQQQEKSSPVRTKLEIKSNSTYFQEIQKRIMKFCQQKKNVI